VTGRFFFKDVDARVVVACVNLGDWSSSKGGDEGEAADGMSDAAAAPVLAGRPLDGSNPPGNKPCAIALIRPGRAAGARMPVLPPLAPPTPPLVLAFVAFEPLAATVWKLNVCAATGAAAATAAPFDVDNTDAVGCRWAMEFQLSLVVVVVDVFPLLLLMGTTDAADIVAVAGAETVGATKGV